MKLEDSVIFDRGELNPYGKYFSGTSYLNMLTLEGVVTANVTFEPGCINNWHTHKADRNGGQILLVTGGRGWYQEEGKEARELHAGDIVYIPSGIKHWHGAAKDSWFVHIAVEVPGENASTEWHEPVDINDYNKLKQEGMMNRIVQSEKRFKELFGDINFLAASNDRVNY